MALTIPYLASMGDGTYGIVDLVNIRIKELRGFSMQKIYLGSLLLACSLILTACGKQESSAPAAPPAPAASPAAAASAEAPAAVAAPASAEAPAPAAAPAASTAAASDGDLALGQSTFKKVCFMCHATGLNGAPKVGDKTEWGPRIAQGKAVLYKHVLEGFTGQKGTMPPRGGSTLPDNEIKAGVDYIVSQAQH